MADIYVLDLAGIEGEYTIKGYEKKIKINSFSHGVSQPFVDDPANQKRTSGRPNHSNFTVTKTLDLSTCKIIDYCNTALPIATMKLTIIQVSGKELLPYMEYDLTDVLVTRVDYGAGGEVPSETISFAYSKITWKYILQAVGVAKSGNDAAGWDLKEVQSAAPA